MKRYRHNLSFYRLSGAQLGELVPVGLMEVLPGDSFRHQVSVLLRVAPLVVPVMHPISVRVHSWYCPSRVLWGGWEDFITGVNTTQDVPQVTVPSSSFGITSAGLLADHLGIPYQTASLAVNALPFRMYNTVYNEYYRDQDLNNKVNPDNLGMQHVCWEKDYYTTARPLPQRGPAQGVQVVASGSNLLAGGTVPSTPVKPDGSAGTTGRTLGIVDTAGEFAGTVTGSFTVEQWRVAMALQKIQEARNRFGSRYTDLLRFYGINPSDARLQRPEYLGGGKVTVSISEVLATASTPTSSTHVGDMAGHGIASIRTRPYRRFFEEHGYVMTLLSLRPKSIYTDAIPRTFGRLKRNDFWQKEDEMLGDQPVYVREVWGRASVNAKSIFGWAPRHQDYRFTNSQIGGAFRTTSDTQWHLGRFFANAPVLNGSFVTCIPATRIYADQATPAQVKMMTYHSVQARRLVSGKARNP